MRIASSLTIAGIGFAALLVGSAVADPYFPIVDIQENGKDGITGIRGARGVAVSLDGAHLYVAGAGDDSVAWFERDPLTGRLAFVGAVQDGVDGVDGIDHAIALVVSPDDRHVYVTGYGESAVGVFRREPASGDLEFVQVLRNGIGGVEGLAALSAIAVRPGGAYVYTSSYYEEAVSVFSRDADTGELTFVAVYKASDPGLETLAEPLGIAISPDGAQLYVVGTEENALLVFEIDAGTGGLTLVQVQQDGMYGLSGLAYPLEVVLSPDGKHLYVATDFPSSTLVVFGRTLDTGLLSFVEVHSNGVNGVRGLGDPHGFAMSSDGERVYITASGGYGIAVFDRDAATGKLTFQSTPGLLGPLQGGGDPMSIVSVDEHIYGVSCLDTNGCGFGDGHGDAVVAFRVVELDCTSQPIPFDGCHRPALRRALFKIKDNSLDAKDRLDWKWKGETTTLADFGDPSLTRNDYVLCAYDESGTPDLILQARAAATARCSEGKRECWKSNRRGFKYKDKRRLSDGVDTLVLKSGESGKAGIAASGKGGDLSLPSLPLKLPLRVQMQTRDGECWEATYSESGVRRNSPSEFKAKSD